jgi:predicted permease
MIQRAMAVFCFGIHFIKILLFTFLLFCSRTLCAEEATRDGSSHVWIFIILLLYVDGNFNELP